MKSRFLAIVPPLLMLVFSVLCCITPALSSPHPSEYNSTELTNRLKTGAYLQKTDNLMIIVDGQRQSGWLKSRSKDKLAQSFIKNIGTTIPKIPHSRMLRVFGPDAESYAKDFSTIFGLYHIDAKGFTPIIATKTHEISEFDPLGITFTSATKDLRKLGGTHAVILLSDGVNIPKSAIYESAYMKKKFGGSVCYYPILLGNDPQGAKNMGSIAKIGNCGFLAQYEAVDSPAELTEYVEKVFFAKRRIPVQPAAAVDSEVQPGTQSVGEGVAPVLTDTAEVKEIIEEPVIPDIIDEESVQRVPVGDDSIIVLERQLPHDKVVTIELHVEFDLNKATLKLGYAEEIKKVADFMHLYPETEALLEGHTCDLGSDDYNQDLSNRRAATVKNYLVKNFAIDPARLKTRGAGEKEPLAGNSTEQNRMKNRRVMAVISTIVTDYVIVEQEILKSDFLRDDFVLPPIDEIVDEMMKQEVVDEPQGVEMPEVVEAPDASESDSLTIEEKPETTTEIEQPQSPATSEDSMQESAPTATGEITPAGEEKSESPQSAPQPAAEDVVVVAPGESAFDDEGTPADVNQLEETVSEPQPPSEEPAVATPENTNENAENYL